MPYGTVKVDNVTFTNNSVDATTTFSGIYASITDNLTLSGTATATTFTGTTANFTNINAQNIGVTTSLSGLAITGGTAGFTTITGTTVTGTTANFVTVSGTTVTGNTGQFTNLAGAAAGFTTITGTTVTGTTANFVSGVFTTRISGTTVTGTTASFTSGVFASLSGTTHTITSGVFASGTAALPSISFVSDPNTGIFSPGADQVAVATNGTGRLFINSTGQVGLGPSASAPDVLIDARHNQNTTSTIRVLNTDAGASADSRLIADNGTDVGGIIKRGTGHANAGFVSLFNSSVTQPLTFLTAGSERLRITSAGLVGIGTSAPSAALQVNGSATVTSQANVAAKLGPNLDSDVLLGSVNGNSPFIASQGAYPLDLRTNNASRLRILSDGNVGIGTTTPQKRLDIYDGASNFWFRDNGVNSEIAVVAEAGGLSALYFGDAADDIRGAVAYNSTDDSLQLRGYNNTERARIDSSGRLLVGTSSAAAGFGNLQSHTTGAFAGFYGNFANDVNPVVLTLGKSRGNDFSTIVQSGDGVGSLRFNATDGTGNLIRAAQINCEVDGTPGTNDMPGRLVFSTTADGAATPTERMRIKADGDVSIVTGNLIIGTAGKGIDFSATANGSGTMTNELLSDYEEGTWTPVNPDLTITNNFTAQYTKIGNVVTVCGDVTYAATPADSSVGGGICSGLPFTAKTGIHYSVAYQLFNDATTGVVIYNTDIFAKLSGTTVFLMQRSTGQAATRSFMASKRFQFTATYTV